MIKPNSILSTIALGFFLFLGVTVTFGQNIFKGTIADYGTGGVIPYATVFLANTTFGVSVDGRIYGLGKSRGLIAYRL